MSQFTDDLNEEKRNVSNSKSLGSWKQNGSTVVWVHTNTKPKKRGFTLIPYVGRDKKDNTKDAIRWFPYVSHEDPTSILKRRPPTHDPLLRLVQLLKASDVDADAVAFDVSVGSKDDVQATVGDLIGEGDWKNKKFDAQVQYVLACIANDSVVDGVVITVEKISLFMSMVDAITKKMDSEGSEAGDPSITPYAFKFQYNPKASKPADYYTAYPFLKVPCTDEIKTLLDTPTVDLSDYVMPGDPNFLREILEKHFVLDLSDLGFTIDDVFDNVRSPHATFTEWNGDDSFDEDKKEKTKAKPPIVNKEDSAPKAIKTRQVEPTKEEPKPARAVKTRQAKVEPTPPPPAEDADFICDNCGAGIPESATDFCPHCKTSLT